MPAPIPSSHPGRQTEVQPPNVPGISGLVTLAVAVVLLTALYIGREVFLPITLAILLAFVLSPFIELLRHWRLGRVPSVVVAVLVMVMILGSLSSIIGYQLAGLAVELPSYQLTIKQKVASLRSGALGHLPDMMRTLGHELGHAGDEPKPAVQQTPSSPLVNPPARESSPVPVEVHEPDATPLELAKSILTPIVAPLASMGIIFVVLVFILFQREDLRDRMIRLFGSSDLHRTTLAMDDAARRLSRYFLMQLGLNTLFGICIALGLWAIGVPNPLLWGIFAALMRFVPYIGSILAALLPAALAAAVAPGWTMTILTLALFFIAEPIMGQVVEPLVYGQSTGLSPFAVVMSAIFWTWLWGPVGLILATPLTLCLVVLGRHVERLEFLDVLLGDRPALSPSENLYQRMLAGDPDEALESAELLLKDRSLTSYYDEVALRSLQLAAGDVSRGVLTAVQLERIKTVIDSLMHDLAIYNDVEPVSHEMKEQPIAAWEEDKPAIKEPTGALSSLSNQAIAESWKAESAVLCIAGRGALDEAASAMLAQLLNKHAIGSRVVPYESVSRSGVTSLDTMHVQMICLSYLDISGTPAHLRYLLRRLRKHIPNVPILVGLWPSGEPVLKNQDLHMVLGADYYVSTLREAVVHALRLAVSPGNEQALANTSSSSERLENHAAVGLRKFSA